MGRTNQRIDVFKHINRHNNDPNVCWEWTRSTTNNRPYFQIDGKKILAYRIVYELVHGTRVPDDKMILHQCDNPLCCNPFEGHACKIGEHQDNMDEMKARERHGLPHHTVRLIKKHLDEGRLTHQDIAGMFGLSREQITAINNGRSYPHVKTGD